MTKTNTPAATAIADLAKTAAAKIETAAPADKNKEQLKQVNAAIAKLKAQKGVAQYIKLAKMQARLKGKMSDSGSVKAMNDATSKVHKRLATKKPGDLPSDSDAKAVSKMNKATGKVHKRLAAKSGAALDLSGVSDKDLGLAALANDVAGAEGMTSIDKNKLNKAMILPAIKDANLRKALLGLYKKSYFADQTLMEALDNELVKRFGKAASIDGMSSTKPLELIAKKAKLPVKLSSAAIKYIQAVDEAES